MDILQYVEKGIFVVCVIQLITDKYTCRYLSHGCVEHRCFCTFFYTARDTFEQRLLSKYLIILMKFFNALRCYQLFEQKQEQYRSSCINPKGDGANLLFWQFSPRAEY